MSSFACTVERIKIEEHPGADALELAVIGGFRSIVKKGQFTTGDTAIYIPETSIVPDDVIEDMGLTGRLAGSKKNRVKAIRLRGVISQGVVYDNRVSGRVPDSMMVLGADVSECLGVTKYTPAIPTELAGQIEPRMGATVDFDVENLKRGDNPFVVGESVVVTEKIHGTWCCLTRYLNNDNETENLVSSKGLSKRGLVLKQNEANKNNVYVRTLQKYEDALDAIYYAVSKVDTPGYDSFNISGPSIMLPNRVHLLGEIYGSVQDLKYGLTNGAIEFRVFAIRVGDFKGVLDDGTLHSIGGDAYLSWGATEYMCNAMEIPIVPVIEKGVYVPVMASPEYASGSTVAGKNKAQIREGVVIRKTTWGSPNIVYEVWDERTVRKNVAENYLVRKKGTEYE